MQEPTPSDTFSPLIEKAIEVASVWHDQTYRKGRWRDEPFDAPGLQVLHIPVISHLTSVGMTLQRAGWDDRTVAAGILHDMIEDANRFRQSMSYDRLRAMIGQPVADLVETVSEPKIEADGSRVPWRRRKEIYLEKLRGGSVQAVAISVADKVHNLWTMNQAVEEGIDVFEDSETRRALSAGPHEQLWFFRSVLNIAERREDRRLDSLCTHLEEEVRRFERWADAKQRESRAKGKSDR